MKFPILTVLVTSLALVRHAVSEIAPEITTIEEGYNIIVKLPCIGCPFLYQDTSTGRDEPWTERKDENALLLNISLPYDSAHLSINTAPLLSPSKILPKIHATQILLDTSVSALDSLISSNALDSQGGASFGLSYAYSLHHIKDSTALLFRFDIMQLWSDLTPQQISVPLDDPAQKVLEVLLLPRPLLSAGDASPAFEIVRVELVSRPEDEARGGRRTMWFLDWDAHGKKGTTAHIINSASDSFVTYITSGVVSLFVFILAVMAVFVGVVVLVVLGCGWHKDDYERAQHGKRSGGRGSGPWGANDVEKARRFRSAEELGIRSSARVVGVGKSD